MTAAAQQAMALLAERSGLTPSDIAGAQSDPLALMMLLASQRQGDDGREDELAALEQRALSAEAQLAEAKQGLRSARSLIESAQALTRYIASIFGSCEHCCGLNALCPVCHGQGSPGYRQPNREELLRWLQGALAQTGLTVMPAPHVIHREGGQTP